MNFPSVADGGINSSYHLEQEEDVVREYSLLETVQRMTLTEPQYTTAAEYQNTDFYAATSTTHEFEYDNNEYPSWDQLDQSNLDSIITDLTPEEVRWFYKSDADKRWLEFNGYDSYRIEIEYRQYNQEWHTTYAQQYNQHGEMYSFEAVPVEQPQQAPESPSKHQIVVRGGMYEVDLNAWKCYSIFWPGEEFQIQRGTWFYEGTWQPVEYPHSDLIENVHLQLFCGHRLADYLDTSKTPREVLHTEKLLTEFHVDWHSPSCVFLYSEATPSKLVRSVTQRLGFQKPTGYRLLRGYKVAASAVDTDRPTNITHLVFVIHGIGQKMDTGRIIRNSNSFRDCVTWLQKKYFTKSEHRAEFFPVEWRSSLKLDGDLVQAITPLHLEKLRQLLNASAMDIMYYTSPLFGKEIQGGLCNELNRLYSMFTERNPNFEKDGGKVSVIAHSLGCVIVYDIVTGWIPPNDTCQGHQCSYRSHEEGAKKAGKSGLLFQIENFFCLGSPLSVFLALRWQDPHKPENHSKVLPPTLCRRLYNVFHPTDPVAYRMEPLLVRGYKEIAPLTLHPYNSGTSRTPYEFMPLEPLQPEGSLGRRMTLGVMEGEKGEETEATSSVPSPPTPSRDRWSLWNLMRVASSSTSTPKKTPQDLPTSTTAGPTSPPHESPLKVLEQRLDFVLKEKQLTASYFAAITSHISYWEDYDVALFVLTRVFPELQEQPHNSSAESSPIKIRNLLPSTSKFVTEVTTNHA